MAILVASFFRTGGIKICGLISREELINKLKNSTNEKLTLKISSYFQVDLTFNGYDLKIETDEIILRELNSKNYISFNLNNIRSMQMEQNEILCNIDDEIDTSIKFIF